MAFHLVKMKFKSPLHLAKGGFDYSDSLKHLHSDTLKSAIFAAARFFYDNDITAEQSDDSNPFLDSFTLSSAFPFYRDEYFFPRPVANVRFDTELGAKAAKKLRYMGQSLFERHIRGETYAIGKSQLWQQGEYASDMPLTNDDQRSRFAIIESEIYQHVTVLRAGDGDPQPFYMERLRFADGAGLFFLIQLHDDAFKKQLTAAINLLGDEGIGSDRSTGNGQFEVEWIEDFKLNMPDSKHECCLNLSLFCPSKADFQAGALVGANSAYRLLRRGGYVASPSNYVNATLRKKPVFFFEEGSVFPFAATQLRGKLMNVRPGAMQSNDPHPVYRDGRALFVPMVAHQNS